MEELKINYKFSLEDFKVMEDIEHSYFPNENISLGFLVRSLYPT